jgi:DNA modification methylase
MPESVRDRCTISHEYIFLLSERDTYCFDQDAIREPLTESSIERVKHAWKSDRANNGIDGAQGIDVEEMGSRFVPKGERNKRSVWFVSPRPFKETHFATYPPELIEPCIKAGCPAGRVVLDPFGGAGTTGLVSDRLGRNAVLCELNPEYAHMAHDRINGDGGLFGAAEVVV